MNQKGQHLAQLLDSGLGALAAGTVMREREHLNGAVADFSAGAFDNLLGDTENRILNLASAVATGFPDLFVDQVQWSRCCLDHRHLSDEHLALNLMCLKEELEEALPSDAVGPASEALDLALACFTSPAPKLLSILDCDREHMPRIRQLLLAILEARRSDAHRIVLEAADSGLSISTIQTQIICPLQGELGIMWQRGELGIHEEHLASGVVKECLTLLRGQMQPKPARGKTVLICSAKGNLHDIGNQILADHFEMDGWQALQLGANMPSNDLAKATIDFDADLVALSVTMALHLRDSANMIEKVREFRADEAPPILVGGPPFSRLPELWRAIGADGYAPDAPSAVGRAEELVG